MGPWKTEKGPRRDLKHKVQNYDDSTSQISKAIADVYIKNYIYNML